MKQLQLKRGTAARWVELNPILAAGEPGFEYDTKKLKIGDGNTSWMDLPYIGGSELCFVTTYAELPPVGDVNCLYKVGDNHTLYQWNNTEMKYESLSNSEGFNPNLINLINGGSAASD